MPYEAGKYKPLGRINQAKPIRPLIKKNVVPLPLIFMNTILVILIILLALRLLFQWLVPLVFPYLLKRLIKKQGGPFDPMNRSADATANEKNSIKKPQNPSKGDDDEYIDFEEIQ